MSNPFGVWDQILTRLDQHSIMNSIMNSDEPDVTYETTTATMTNLLHVVHILHKGRSFCDISDRCGAPERWPEGHAWIPLVEFRSGKLASCASCMDAFGFKPRTRTFPLLGDYRAVLRTLHALRGTEHYRTVLLIVHELRLERQHRKDVEALRRDQSERLFLAGKELAVRDQARQAKNEDARIVVQHEFELGEWRLDSGGYGSDGVDTRPWLVRAGSASRAVHDAASVYQANSWRTGLVTNLWFWEAMVPYGPSARDSAPTREEARKAADAWLLARRRA